MFNETDLKKYRALKLLLSQSKVELNVNTIAPLATAVQWYEELEKKIEGSIAMQKAEIKDPPIKELKRKG